MAAGDGTLQDLLAGEVGVAGGLWQTLAEQSPDHIMLLDLEGRIRYVNRTVPDLTISEVLGREQCDFVPPAFQQRARDALVAAREGRSPVAYEIEYHPIDGSSVQHFDVRVGPVFEGGEVVAFIVRASNVTERVQATRSLHEKTELHRLTFEHAPFGICRFDERGVVTACNQVLARVLGAPVERIVGFDMLAGMIHPEQRAALLAALAGGAGIFEGEYTSVTGGKTSMLRTVYCAIAGEDGRPSGGLAFVEDFTELRARELELHRAQRLESLGLLAGGLAHDFNNLMTPILLATEQLRRGLTGERLEQTLRSVRRAAERAGGLASQLLTFSRQQALAFERLDVAELVSTRRELLRRLLREDIELEICLPDGPAWALAEGARIEQALLNLTANAQDAMPEGGRLRIELRRDRRTDPRGGGIRAEVGWVILEVSDTGVGMSAETRGRIFDPFFSTKERGRGTGLGLATVHGIVRQHRGFVEVESEPGVGTTFTLGLPATEPDPRAVAGTTGPEDATPPGRGESVLVVEDDTDVRAMTAEILESLGYRVITAASGVEALARLDAHGGKIQLLVSDVVMPGLSGPALCAAVSERRPGMRHLFISGYAEGLGESGEGLTASFLPKPFSVSALARAVRHALDGDGPK